ncbi:GGDEF domain protein [Alloalcanivorax dieselolei B5]|uniref:diguanylate cyclase n=1 Tax=Alcanivorax dieselolei (strain DSM 16502 / CGMCC 1.3690 / MCCC 1A00001 / B-5) TaxID=930169 RepID=K0CGL7_ALCDB|nr:GGDEF domain-containing protein [Alloalcanivorax dieselolei]AFT71540.1 GGDEF domain protein [Alloalcanivorax dieselolei B5]GGJ90092.1 hypothetical protein GCM10007426_19090 [Alloalcanivorax dieselolei]
MQQRISRGYDKQEFRRLSLAALLGAGAHTLVCWLALQWGFFALSPEAFFLTFLALWFGHLVVWSLACLTLRNGGDVRRFTEPVLVWSTVALLVSALFLSDHRLLVMVFFLAVLQIGVFRVGRWQLLRLALLGVGGYALVLLELQSSEPRAFNAMVEWQHWLLFTLAVVLMMLLALEIVGIRRRIDGRNEALQQMARQVRDLAIRDELTGLYGRRHAMELLTKACGQARRGAYLLAVVFVDLDHFKAINDRYGHLIGDRVLIRFADLLRRHLQPPALAARMGGEEFLLILPVSHREQARELVERILAELREQGFEDQPDLNVTASAGLALAGTGEEADQVLARADRLLYQAKQAGRDRLLEDA